MSNGEGCSSHIIPYPGVKLTWDDNPVEEKLNHEEWKVAVETLLPRLLKPRRPSEDSSQQHSNYVVENSSNNILDVQNQGFPNFQHYVDNIRDFGRWLSSFGSFVTTKLGYRNPSTVSLTNSQMKDFLVLLGEPMLQIQKCIFQKSLCFRKTNHSRTSQSRPV